ncbi:hypothetical protein D3C72_2358990 [compost metagenome]
MAQRIQGLAQPVHLVEAGAGQEQATGQGEDGKALLGQAQEGQAPGAIGMLGMQAQAHPRQSAQQHRPEHEAPQPQQPQQA